MLSKVDSYKLQQSPHDSFPFFLDVLYAQTNRPGDMEQIAKEEMDESVA